MVNGEVVFAIHNRARLDRPKRVANRKVRRVNINVGSVLAVGRLEELRVGVQHALHRAQRVVFKVKRGGEMVVGSVGVERQPQLVSVVGNASDGGVCAQRVVGCRDVQNGVAILAVVVDEMRQSGFEVHLAVAVVDLPFQMHRLAQRERNFKEIFEPFSVGDIRADAEIVANRLRLLRQTGQSRKFAAHEVRETLGEGFVIVLPLDLDIGKVALEAQTATVARVRSRQIQLVEGVLSLARNHFKLFNIDVSVGGVKLLSGDVGVDVEFKRRVAPLVAQVERGRVEVADIRGEVGGEFFRRDFSDGRKLCVGVVHIDFSVENAVLQNSVEVDFVVRIIAEIEARNASFRLERKGRRRLISCRQLSVDADLRGNLAEFVVVEDALQVQAVGFQVSVEILAIFREGQIGVARVGFQQARRRQILSRSAGFSLKRNVAQSEHFLGQFDASRKRLDAVLRRGQSADVGKPLSLTRFCRK